jgi:hypothetical protein
MMRSRPRRWPARREEPWRIPVERVVVQAGDASRIREIRPVVSLVPGLREPHAMSD